LIRPSAQIHQHIGVKEYGFGQIPVVIALVKMLQLVHTQDGADVDLVDFLLAITLDGEIHTLVTRIKILCRTTNPKLQQGILLALVHFLVILHFDLHLGDLLALVLHIPLKITHISLQLVAIGAHGESQVVEGSIQAGGTRGLVQSDGGHVQ